MEPTPKPPDPPPLRAIRHGPRERLHQLGEARLGDAECLALLLRTGRCGESAEAMAQRLLRRFGGLPGLATAEVRELAGVPGVGPVRAAALRAAFGLARRLAEAALRPGMPVRGGGDVARLVRDSVRGSGQESFFAVPLDRRHRVLSVRVVGTGGVDAVGAHPRDVYAPAIRDGAAALVVAHNHPSGDPTPSAQDRAVTERLGAAGRLLGIELLDHVVVGDVRYFSFADESFGAIV
ncbi:MAG: DNA repair protein RadC [Phycisphaerales bacterium]|jgi:DNA repair protein RadC|nr:DNA repair protein RadC [Phycisphaerales bacterium]